MDDRTKPICPVSGSEQELQQVHCMVRGHVQGVGFRAFTVSVAQRFDITGWVRNLPDGETLEVVAEGSPEQLSRFLQVLRQGPSAARVMEMRESRQPASGRFSEFSVRH